VPYGDHVYARYLEFCAMQFTSLSAPINVPYAFAGRNFALALRSRDKHPSSRLRAAKNSPLD
jgi:hypothetical protein